MTDDIGEPKRPVTFSTGKPQEDRPAVTEGVHGPEVWRQGSSDGREVVGGSGLVDDDDGSSPDD